jgi:hypothetical protein
VVLLLRALDRPGPRSVSNVKHNEANGEDNPVAVLALPVVLDARAKAPRAVLAPPVVSLERASPERRERPLSPSHPVPTRGGEEGVGAQGGGPV